MNAWNLVCSLHFPIRQLYFAIGAEKCMVPLLEKIFAVITNQPQFEELLECICLGWMPQGVPIGQFLLVAVV